MPVSHATPFMEQLEDISLPIPEKPVLLPAIHRVNDVVEKSLNHRTRKRRFQFLMLMEGAPLHDTT